MSAQAVSKSQAQKRHSRKGGQKEGEDPKISKAVLRRVAHHLENHFNYEIQENSFVTRSGSQRESLVLYNFPVSKQYQRKEPSDAVPQLVKPKVKRSVKKSISNPYVRCLVRTTNEVVAKYPVKKLEKLHIRPLDAESSKVAQEEGRVDHDDDDYDEDEQEAEKVVVNGDKAAQEPNSISGADRARSSHLGGCRIIGCTWRACLKSRTTLISTIDRPKLSKKEVERREAMVAAKKLIDEPKQPSAGCPAGKSPSTHSSASRSSADKKQPQLQEDQPSSEKQFNDGSSSKSSHSTKKSENSKSTSGRSSSEPEVAVHIRVLGGGKPENEDRLSKSSGNSVEQEPDNRSTSDRDRSSKVRVNKMQVRISQQRYQLQSKVLVNKMQVRISQQRHQLQSKVRVNRRLRSKLLQQLSNLTAQRNLDRIR
uniref:Bromodomain adjacent to zinc finger domain protein 2B n=1 Tax=Macrostomum lignano TaxID=282301 RepID=A0A1I8GH26_9PLAT